MSLVDRPAIVSRRPLSTDSCGARPRRRASAVRCFIARCVCLRGRNLYFSVKIKKQIHSLPCSFICSLFELYKYYLHVMGFWPRLLETKSITREPLSLPSFKIPDSLWHRKRTMETCHGVSLGLLLSLHLSFSFPFPSPPVSPFPFWTSHGALRETQILFHWPSQFWSPNENMRFFREPFRVTRLVNFESAGCRRPVSKEGEGDQGTFLHVSCMWFRYQVATSLTLPTQPRGNLICL